MPINENYMDLSKFRGPVSPCPVCTTTSDAAKLDAMSSGKACHLCLNKKFIALCTNCGGTGKYRGRTIWDGGRSEYASTCTPCGGTGVFPVSKPADWNQEKWDAETARRNAAVCVCTHNFGSHNDQHRDPDNIGMWTTGHCRAKIGIAVCPCEQFRTAPAYVDPPKDVEQAAIPV